MQISVSRALTELKTIDKKIVKKIDDHDFASITIGGKMPPGQGDLQTFTADVKANYQSIRDLIETRSRMKSAITKSNSCTDVKIGDRTYTVAEAIDMKKSIEYIKKLRQKIISSYATFAPQVSTTNTRMQARLDELLKSMLGKESKVKDTEYESISKPFIANNEAKLVDPLNLLEKREELDDEIADFENNVDVVLSESNARTMIEI